MVGASHRPVSMTSRPCDAFCEIAGTHGSSRDGRDACLKILRELSQLCRRRDLSGKGRGELEGHSQRGYVATQEKKWPSEGRQCME